MGGDVVMADAMLNSAYRESTLPPLPLPAAPSVGSFAALTPELTPRPHTPSPRDQHGENTAPHPPSQQQQQQQQPPVGGAPLAAPPAVVAIVAPAPTVPRVERTPAAAAAAAAGALSSHPTNGGTPAPAPAPAPAVADVDRGDHSPASEPRGDPGDGGNKETTDAAPSTASATVVAAPATATAAMGHHTPPPASTSPQPPPSHHQYHIHNHNQHHHNHSSHHHHVTPTQVPAPTPAHSPPHVPAPAPVQPPEQHLQQQQQRRSVVIKMPEQQGGSSKRRKPSQEMAAALVVQEINTAVTQRDRNKAVHNALASFDHNNPALHDDEIMSGADAALTKHLALLLYKEQLDRIEHNNRTWMAGKATIKSEGDHLDASGGGKGDPHRPGQQHADDSCPNSCEELCEEITNTCEAIEMVYRGSAASVEASHRKVGTELLPMLIRMVECDIRNRRRSPSPVDGQLPPSPAPDKCQSEANLAGAAEKTKRKVSDADTNSNSNASASGSMQDQQQAPQPEQEEEGEEEYVSPTQNKRLRKSTKVIGHFARVGSLTQPLAYHPGLLPALKHVIDIPAGVVPREARLNCLWIIANLACNAENMVMMACQPGLLSILVRTAHRPIEEEEDSIGDIERYVEAIRSRSIAVRALLNLSWAPENKLLLSEQPDLVEALTRTLMYRSSTWAGFGRGVSGILLQSRRLAAGALRNLAAAPIRNKIRLCRGGGGALLDTLSDAARRDTDLEVRAKVVATLHNLACADTAKGFVERSALLEVIADVAVFDGDAGNLASRTLRVLERSITEDMEESYRTLRPVLDRVAAEKVGV